MKVTVTEDLGIQLEEVFSGLTLKTASGETIAICMRDSGFEFKYQGEWYFAKEGYVEPFHKSVHENYLGLFEDSDGSLINADLNGALNILRKVVGNFDYDPIEVCSTPLVITIKQN